MANAVDCDHCGMAITSGAMWQLLKESPIRNYHANRSYCLKAMRAAAKVTRETPWNTKSNPLSGLF